MLWRYFCRAAAPIKGVTIPSEGLHGSIDGHFENVGRADLIWGIADYMHPLTNQELHEYGLEYFTKYETEDKEYVD